MSSDQQSRSRRRGDVADGFTLVELVIVVAIMGIIATALANAVTAVLRSNVSVSTRVDDSRDLLALTTWLPQDVNSTPASTGPGTGVELGDNPSGCTTTDVGVGLLRLTWAERPGTAAATTYRVSYRAVTNNGATQIVRMSCPNFGPAAGSNATYKLPLLPGGGLPVSVSTSGSKVVFTVTQHPGTPTQKLIQIEAVSKNPAIATLPPPPPPPPPATMTITPSPVDAGSSVTANVAGLAPAESLTFYMDYTSAGSIATATASSAGAASTVLIIPLSTTNGYHQIYVEGASKSFAASQIFVNNATIALSPTTVLAGNTVVVDVSGFDKNDIVTFLLDSNTVVGPPGCSAANACTLTITASTKSMSVLIPGLTPGGLHIISASATPTGRRAVSSGFTVSPAFSLSPATVAESLTTSAVVYGFHAAESITYTLDSLSGPVLAPAGAAPVADINGYNNTSLTVPAFTTAGSHTIFATGSDISLATAVVNVTTSLREYKITTSTPSVTAGSNATLSLQATINAVNDPTLNGVVPITVTGAGSSPNNSAPAASPTSANFVNGVATISVNMVNAVPTTINVTDGLRSGSSPAITVNASTAYTLAFAVACPAPIKNNWTSGITVVDVYGNLVNAAAVTLAFSPAWGSSTSVTDLDSSGWITLATKTSYSSSTDATGKTPSFTATGPKGSSHNPSVILTATSNSRSVSCTVTS
jgi:prepilin-type N-terminal cleavage/methylation domain-containing protein